MFRSPRQSRSQLPPAYYWLRFLDARAVWLEVMKGLFAIATRQEELTALTIRRAALSEKIGRMVLLKVLTMTKTSREQQIPVGEWGALQVR